MEIPRLWRLKDIRLRLQGEACPHCNTKIIPPRPICPTCNSEAPVVLSAHEAQAVVNLNNYLVCLDSVEIKQ